MSAVSRYVGLMRSGQHTHAAEVYHAAMREMHRGPSSHGGYAAQIGYDAKVQAMRSVGVTDFRITPEYFRR